MVRRILSGCELASKAHVAAEMRLNGSFRRRSAGGSSVVRRGAEWGGTAALDASIVSTHVSGRAAAGERMPSGRGCVEGVERSVFSGHGSAWQVKSRTRVRSTSGEALERVVDEVSGGISASMIAFGRRVGCQRACAVAAVVTRVIPRPDVEHASNLSALRFPSRYRMQPSVGRAPGDCRPWRLISPRPPSMPSDSRCPPRSPGQPTGKLSKSR